MPDADQAGSFQEARRGLPDVSADVSVFWKPLRRLIQDGNPVDPVTVLFYDMRDGKKMPFLSIAKTRGNRLIVWPPSDALEQGEFADGCAFAVDHATLELSSGETHFTRFDATGQRIHENRGWTLASSEDGLKLWLIGAFRVALLEQQIGALEQDVRMPLGDSKRRGNEFRRYAAQMTRVAVSTPPLRGDCLVTVIHVLPDLASFRGPVKPAHFPTGSFWRDWIDGWPDGDIFQIAATGINVGGVNLILLTASPLGRLRAGCFLGGVSSHPGRA